MVASTQICPAALHSNFVFAATFNVGFKQDWLSGLRQLVYSLFMGEVSWLA